MSVYMKELNIEQGITIFDLRTSKIINRQSEIKITDFPRIRDTFAPPFVEGGRP